MPAGTPQLRLAQDHAASGLPGRPGLGGDHGQMPLRVSVTARPGPLPAAGCSVVNPGPAAHEAGWDRDAATVALPGHRPLTRTEPPFRVSAPLTVGPRGTGTSTFKLGQVRWQGTLVPSGSCLPRSKAPCYRRGSQDGARWQVSTREVTWNFCPGTTGSGCPGTTAPSPSFLTRNLGFLIRIRLGLDPNPTPTGIRSS